MKRHESSKLRMCWRDGEGEIEAAGWPAVIVAVALAVAGVAWAAAKFGMI